MLGIVYLMPVSDKHSDRRWVCIQGDNRIAFKVDILDFLSRYPVLHQLKQRCCGYNWEGCR